MGGATLPRLLVAAFLVLAIAVTTIEVGRNGEESCPAATAGDPAQEPLRGELQRCQSLGDAALHDSACLNAWAENRRRFLGNPYPSERGN